jgi:hypothetical protein
LFLFLYMHPTALAADDAAIATLQLLLLPPLLPHVYMPHEMTEG